MKAWCPHCNSTHLEIVRQRTAVVQLCRDCGATLIVSVPLEPEPDEPGYGHGV